jgi:hypothetical protein
MDYAELRQGIEYFERKWPPNRSSDDYTYEKLRQRDAQRHGYWLHLEGMSSEELAKDVVGGFLNHWKCRIPTKDFKQWYDAGYNLKDAVDKLPEYYASLASFKIESVDFAQQITLKHATKTIQDVVDSIYSIFLQIKTKFGPVAASKLMHMALSDLFVMWDDGIIQHHCIPKQSFAGVKQKARSYVGFLILMQENICHVIESYPRRSQLTRPEVVQEVRAAHNNLPLPRLLDMANMAVRDCEQAICIACMRKAKARWAMLGLVNTNSSMDEDSAD